MPSGLLKTMFAALLSSLLPFQSASSQNAGAHTTKPATLSVRGVGEIDGVEHTIMAPENRADPESRRIAVRFMVLPAANPSNAPPVVYLAGGPGGSATGTARGPRWPLFDALRRERDVVLLDQRGTGRSERPPECLSSVGWTADEVATRSAFIAKHKAALEDCEAHWRDAGVDLRGYTTAESAADIAAVADALDREVSLLGIQLRDAPCPRGDQSPSGNH